MALLDLSEIKNLLRRLATINRAPPQLNPPPNIHQALKPQPLPQITLHLTLPKKPPHPNQIILIPPLN